MSEMGVWSIVDVEDLGFLDPRDEKMDPFDDSLIEDPSEVIYKSVHWPPLTVFIKKTCKLAQPIN